MANQNTLFFFLCILTSLTSLENMANQNVHHWFLVSTFSLTSLENMANQTLAKKTAPTAKNYL